MSRAFVREDRDEDFPRAHFSLPPVDDPSYDSAAAYALLRGACEGHLTDAEVATGYRWGDPQLAEPVRRLLEKENALSEDVRDARLLQLARRYLRKAGQ